MIFPSATRFFTKQKRTRLSQNEDQTSHTQDITTSSLLFLFDEVGYEDHQPV